MFIICFLECSPCSPRLHTCSGGAGRGRAVSCRCTDGGEAEVGAALKSPCYPGRELGRDTAPCQDLLQLLAAMITVANLHKASISETAYQSHHLIHNTIGFPYLPPLDSTVFNSDRNTFLVSSTVWYFSSVYFTPKTKQNKKPPKSNPGMIDFSL